MKPRSHLFGLLLVPALFIGTASADAAPAENHWGSDGNAPISEEFGRAIEFIEVERYTDALPILKTLSQSQPGNADVWNMLGYAYRKTGDLDRSGMAYRGALLLDPHHPGALAYQGELFLMRGDVAAAKANLARLRASCGDCEEAGELAAAVAAH